jgi:hypothetical protein
MIYQDKWIKLTPEGQQYLEEKMERANKGLGLSDKEQDEMLLLCELWDFREYFRRRSITRQKSWWGALDIPY